MNVLIGCPAMPAHPSERMKLLSLATVLSGRESIAPGGICLSQASQNA
jgi:hypothetical protein